MIDNKEAVIEDWLIVSFLSLPEIQKKYKLSITPFNENHRVKFIVRGDFNSAIREFYQNKTVGILDFMQAVKAIRSTIFTLKNIQTNKEDGLPQEKKED